ncbi:MAG: hypothetical protein VX644_06310 [Planctomycetota bacterium]|nr:hypothetical protein [Planctomycetota bacterium]
MSTRLHLKIALLLTLLGCQQEPSGHPELPAETASSQRGPDRKAPPLQPTTYLALTYDIRGPGENLAGGVVELLNKRLDPHGIERIRIRLTEAKQVEILVPGDPTPSQLARIKYRVCQPGHLEFRILANRQRHGPLLKLVDMSPSATELSEEKADGTRKLVGKWIQIARGPADSNNLEAFKYVPQGDVVRDAMTGQRLSLEDFQPGTTHPGLDLARYLHKRSISNIEILVFTVDGYHLTNELINSATSLATEGQSAIDLHFTPAGAAELARLTASNAPSPVPGDTSRLAMILDEHVLSAPRIIEEIRSQHALISGDFDAGEVENLAAILSSGALAKQLELVFHEQRPVTLAVP